ncbi:hypothetical protein [Mesorhizobium sp. B263B2A]|uniref:hypothetical protein n=1 Tax=Mesorhizobium sp. B263B2A TaxID=2876669 RepID=UPI001CD115CB|nr:hypothetical protein [Mesorhizobium sp. B263B2A]MCA0029478.1 hypothetical protein [Mesorhizobium sp. B263B2A]
MKYSKPAFYPVHGARIGARSPIKSPSAGIRRPHTLPLHQRDSSLKGQPGTLSPTDAFMILQGTDFFRRLTMHSFEMIDLLCVVEACKRDHAVGNFVSMAEGVEELRVLTGDFVSSDHAVANALSKVALARGCSVLFDEQAGAEIPF